MLGGWAIRPVSLLALLLLVGGCGLPTLSTIPAPFGPESGVTPGVVSFRGLANNHPHMLGYEIYYKLIDFGDAGPEITHHEELRAGFGRLSRVGLCDDENMWNPLIDVTDVESEHTISLDMTFASETDAEPHLTLSWSSEVVVVRRGISGDLGNCRRFSAIDGYDKDHRDISDAAVDAISDGSLIDLIVYAVSYGRDRARDLYSVPLLVGRLRLDDFPYG